MLQSTNPAPVHPWRAEAGATFALAWPLILTNLAQHGLNTVDVVLLGWLDAEALAAGALAHSLYFAVMIFGIGLVTATAPMMAQELGARRHSVRDIRRTVRQGCWIAVAFSIPAWLVLWNGEALLLLFGQERGLAAQAGAYLRILQWGLLPFLIYLVLRSYVAALGRPGFALAVCAAALPVNAVLAWGLIFGRLGLPRLGLIGAGLATAIVCCLMAVGLALLILRDRRMRRYRLFGRFWRADPVRFMRLLRLGIPIGATLAFEVTIFNAAALVMGTLSTAELAAHTIALQIAALSFMVPMGLGQAVTIRVGHAVGRGDPAGVARAGWTAFTLGTGFMTFMALVMVAVPGALVGAFLDATNPANAPVIGYALTFLMFAALFQVADGAQAVGAGMLRGLGDTRVPMLYAALGYWGVGAPLGVALAYGTALRGSGVWIGLASGLAVVAVLMLVRWTRRTDLGLVERRLVTA
ncbi:MATE family efflux transporter [Salinarimonas soli]|uniref:Multidrug-efflux transporter n=1 Tax=Salinarimonas soli TaxID=1638099 RepID=A0A5B2VGW5_9HYPH|nr:MATE family efflux transporter [Salinarimonas soli]KAA2238361.1 MATE family efflux transporter [Salinarimonas soli]